MTLPLARILTSAKPVAKPWWPYVVYGLAMWLFLYVVYLFFFGSG